MEIASRLLTKISSSLEYGTKSEKTRITVRIIIIEKSIKIIGEIIRWERIVRQQKKKKAKSFLL